MRVRVPERSIAAARRRFPRGQLGIVLGVSAALAFGAGGAIVKPLFAEGWSPSAAVLARIAVGAVVLTIPALAAIRGDLRRLWRARRLVLAYAAIAVVGTQLAMYASFARIPVSVTLLIEYLAPVLLLLFAWARTRRVPHRVVLLGAAVAIVGLVLVIGPTGSGALDPLGVVFACIAMVGVALYYLLGDRAAGELPPVTLAWSGFALGAILLAITGAAGLFPLRATFGEADFLGGRAPWWVPVLVVGVVATAYAYVAGVTAIGLLGSRVASFLGLSEVIFAGIIGWILLDEAIGPVALVGAALILGGIVLVRLEPGPADVAPLPEPLPMTGPIELPAESAPDP